MSGASEVILVDAYESRHFEVADRMSDPDEWIRYYQTGGCLDRPDLQATGGFRRCEIGGDTYRTVLLRGEDPVSA